MATAALLIQRWNLAPKVVVINADEDFFLARINPPTREIIDSRRSAFYLTYHKRLGQRIQLWLRDSLGAPAITPNNQVSTVFRSRADGAWLLDYAIGSRPVFIPVGNKPDDPTLEVKGVPEPRIRKFRELLPADPQCIVVLRVPWDRYAWSGTRKIAELIGATHVSAEMEGLGTLDGRHLERQSAERWSQAIMARMEPTLSRCAGTR